LIKNPCAKFREEKKWGAQFTGHTMLKAATERHLAMLRQNRMNGSLPSPNATAKNPQTEWRHNGTGLHPPARHRQATAQPTPSLPGMPPVPPGANETAQCSQIDNLPPGYVYLHAPLPRAQCFNPDAYAQDSQPDTDYNPDMLTDEGISTG